MRFTRGLVGITIIPMAFLLCAPASAQLARARIRISADIDRNRAVTLEQETHSTILSDRAVQTLSQSAVSTSANQTAEILEAYTRKADGRIVPVEMSEIATQQGAVGPLITFLDASVRQVPFRDVAVGDTVVLKTRYTEREHYVPGHFSYFVEARADGIEREFDFTLRAPVDVPIRHGEQAFSFSEGREGDVLVRHWSGKFNPEPINEPWPTDVSRALPHFAFSTFDSYEAIGRAYAASAAAKLQLTPKVTSLAEQITAGKTSSAETTDAIFQWVAKNIRYVGVYFGAGRIVPNDIDLVLARGFGDCKDKAALVTALLAAKGIRAEQVLIHTGTAFELPETPIQQAFNHVIVYVPALDRYMDPSDPRSTLGSLPQLLAGKPVVRASAGPEGATAALARTPVSTLDDNTAHISANVTLTSEGATRSETRVSATGEFAQALRQFATGVEARGGKVVATELARKSGWPGEASVEVPPSANHREPYVLQLTWTAEKPVPLPKEGWRPGGVLSPLVATALNHVASLQPLKRMSSGLCRPAHVIQDYLVRLPDGMGVKPVPQPIDVEVPFFSYRRSWSLDGQDLRVHTEIASTFETRSCSPEKLNAISEALDTNKDKINPTVRLIRFGDEEQH